VEIRTFGAFSISVGSAAAPDSSRAQLSLLKLLIAQSGAPLPVARGASELCAGRGSASARSVFDTAAHRVRRCLGDDSLLRVDGGFAQLDRARIWVDAWALDALCTSVQRLDVHAGRDQVDWLCTRLLDLYRGVFCDGEQQASIVRARASFSRVFAKTSIRVTDHFRRLGDLERAIDFLDAAIARDDASEPLHRALIDLWLERGYPSEAHNAYERCRTLLWTRLRLEPANCTAVSVRATAKVTARWSAGDRLGAPNREA
jgi:DNA-binding SARP family transcriptional activator